MKSIIIVGLLVCVLAVKADYRCINAGGYCHIGRCGGYQRRGLCNGGRDRVCCIDTAGDRPCTNAGGTCQTTACSGQWRIGKCAGPTGRKCCIDISRDSACTDIGGTCQTTSCSGTTRIGLCSGSVHRTCCVRSSSNGNSGDKLSHSAALSMLTRAGIGITSSDGCSDRNVRTCTSLEQIRRATIEGTINELKIPSGCPIVVTGGTERGHSGGTHSHWNGYKIDLGLNSCLNTYIKETFPFSHWRKNHRVYRAPSGNEYALEHDKNHWDNTYY